MLQFRNKLCRFDYFTQRESELNLGLLARSRESFLHVGVHILTPGNPELESLSEIGTDYFGAHIYGYPKRLEGKRYSDQNEYLMDLHKGIYMFGPKFKAAFPRSSEKFMPPFMIPVPVVLHTTPRSGSTLVMFDQFLAKYSLVGFKGVGVRGQ